MNKDKAFISAFLGCVIALIIAVSFKLFGSSLFSLAVLEDLDIPSYLEIAINLFVLNIHLYLMICTVSDIKGKKVVMFQAVTFPLFCIFQYLSRYAFDYFNISFIDIIYVFMIIALFNKKNIKKFRFIKISIIILLNILYQLISIYIKDIGLHYDSYSFMIELVFSIDYLLLAILGFLMNDLLVRKEVRLCHGSLLGGLKESVTLLQDSFGQLSEHLSTFFIGLVRRPKGSTKSDTPRTLERSLNRLDEIGFRFCYGIVFIGYNLGTLACILLIGRLMGKFETTVLILIAFLINKKVFGKEFHLKNAFYCFCSSCIMFYCLISISPPIYISIFTPILVGISLALILNFVARYTSNDLYKGMPLKELEENCKAKNLNKYQKDLLIDYYVNRMTRLKLASKNKYSIESIDKHLKEARDLYKK